MTLSRYSESSLLKWRMILCVPHSQEICMAHHRLFADSIAHSLMHGSLLTEDKLWKWRFSNYNQFHPKLDIPRPLQVLLHPDLGTLGQRK